MFKIRKYEIIIGKIETKKVNSFQKIIYLKDKVDILLKIEYLDNYQKTFGDLKDYIFELSNFTICPNSLYLISNTVLEDFGLYNTDLKLIKCEDEKLLSSMFLSKKFYLISVFDKLKYTNLNSNICYCHSQQKNNFKKTKTQIINELEDKKNIIERYERNLSKKTENEKKINELKKMNKEKETQIENLSYENKNYKENIQKYENEKNYSQKIIDDLKIQLNKKTVEFNQNNNIIQQIKNENEKNMNKLASYEEKLKKQSKEIQNLIKQNDEKIIVIDKLNQEVNNLKLTIQNQNNRINELNSNNEIQNENLKILQEKEKKNIEKIKLIENEKNICKKIWMS